MTTTTVVPVARAVAASITTLPAVGFQDVDAYPVRISAFTNDDGMQNHCDGLAVGTFVYADLNCKGVFDPGEYWPRTGSSQSPTSIRLPIGTYTLREQLPAGYVDTGRFTISTTAGKTFVADGRVRMPDDTGTTPTAVFTFGNKPQWLSASADAYYTLANNTFTLYGGTITFLSDAPA